jgi:tetratricopeptide (TPR) repeat protein
MAGRFMVLAAPIDGGIMSRRPRLFNRRRPVRKPATGLLKLPVCRRAILNRGGSMPHIVNGCGTWYYGKSNKQSYVGTCRSCGKTATLTSYDTRLFVVIVMIPIVPLGKKRIIEQCGACSRHLAMPLADYREAESRMQQTLDAYRNAPADAEAAKEFLKTVCSFRNERLFLAAAPDLEANLQNAEGLGLLAAAYQLFNRLGDAERVLRKALEIDNTDELSEFLAEVLLRQGKPEEAEPYLSHIVENGIPDRVDALYHLAQVYQSCGQHEKALQAFDYCEQVNPPIAQDETFKRLREVSDKNRGTAKPVPLGAVAKKIKGGKSRRKYARVAAVIGVLVVLGYLVVAFLQGQYRTVYLVNGLGTPYTVDIDGTTYRAGPRSFQKITLGEGSHKVAITDVAAPLNAPQTVQINTSFLARPFSSDAFIINPDASAILEQQKLFYSKSGNLDPKISYTGGAVLQKFEDIDYPFNTPPDTISLDSSSSVVSRTTLKLPEVPDMSDSSLLLILQEKLGPAVVPIARNRFMFDPDSQAYGAILSQVLSKEESLAYYKPLLAVRPLRMQWHRAYQETMLRGGGEEPVRAEYAQMLAAEPQNKDLNYLASRVEPDPDKMLALLQASAAGESPCAYGLYSLGLYEAELGQFDAAAKYLQQATALMPAAPEVTFAYVDALTAAENYPQALQVLQKADAEPWPVCLQAYMDEINVFSRTNKPQQVEETIQKARSRFAQMSAQVSVEVATQLRRIAAYCQSGQRFSMPAALISDADSRFIAAVSKHDIKAAEAALLEEKDSAGTARSYLALYIAAVLERQTASAQTHLAAARKLLSEGDYEDRSYAAALGGDGSIKPETLLKLRCGIEEKRLRLAALALSDPANAAAYAELGRKLNYNLRFPHLLIEEAFAGASRGQ